MNERQRTRLLKRLGIYPDRPFDEHGPIAPPTEDEYLFGKAPRAVDTRHFVLKQALLALAREEARTARRRASTGSEE